MTECAVSGCKNDGKKRGKVWQCKKVHYLCDTDYDNTKNCPICDEPPN